MMKNLEDGIISSFLFLNAAAQILITFESF